MNKNYLKEILHNTPLFFGGLFMIYLAAVDQTLFNAIFRITTPDRLIASLATTTAASVPMFFAVGLIKRGIFIRWETIYYYEKMLEGKIFWILTDILLITISSLIVVQRLILPYGILVTAGCLSLSAYIIFYRFKLKKNHSP